MDWLYSWDLYHFDHNSRGLSASQMVGDGEMAVELDEMKFALAKEEMNLFCIIICAVMR